MSANCLAIPITYEVSGVVTSTLNDRSSIPSAFDIGASYYGTIVYDPDVGSAAPGTTTEFLGSISYVFTFGEFEFRSEFAVPTADARPLSYGDEQQFFAADELPLDNFTAASGMYTEELSFYSGHPEATEAFGDALELPFLDDNTLHVMVRTPNSTSANAFFSFDATLTALRVPEPHSGVLALIGVGFLWSSRRRKLAT